MTPIVIAALVWLALVLAFAAACGVGRLLEHDPATCVVCRDATNGGAGDAAPTTAPRTTGGSR